MSVFDLDESENFKSFDYTMSYLKFEKALMTNLEESLSRELLRTKPFRGLFVFNNS